MITLLLLVGGCTQQTVTSSISDSSSASSSATSAPTMLTYTDATGREVQLPLQPQRVAALLGSFAELWELAGGTLVGITSDALEENRISHSPQAELLGGNHEPNLELLLALEPDLVLLTADLSTHRDLEESLNRAGFAFCFLKIEIFDDYLAALQLCTALTGRDDLYQQNGIAVQREIEAIQSKIATAEKKRPSILLLRAMSTAVKAKGNDIMAGLMLEELGAEHLVTRYPSLLDDLSLETILLDNPDYIFTLTMGDADKALTTMRKQLEENPVWQELSAVRNDRYLVLPKELFHFKPNARWGEAYAYLARILYPDLFPADKTEKAE